MPELPEVQTVVSDLNKKIIGKKITGIWFDAPKIIKKSAPKNFSALIKGAVIKEVKRRGKNILIYLQKSQRLNVKGQKLLLLIHQKMTGHLLIGKWKIENKKIRPLKPAALKEKVNDYIHFIFKLDDGRMLGLSDLRKFAKVLCGSVEEIKALPELLKIGPEPLAADFNFGQFQKIISKEKRKIKQVLLDQEVIAGIGNIYSDDILWQARIHPFKPADKLSGYELKNIYKAMKMILNKAVNLRGTSISDFRDTAGKAGGYGNIRLVYRRENEPCKRCQAPIKRVKIGGRSARFCSFCQKL
ncbi:MAG: DNA-formamidopyrimidine glycosylase [Candidatus Brennerbacteria bacterium]|nr:DNA-formamidopyrimidine glycosylase [Candidatus Brennerbacteria bacterium]